MKRLLVIAAVAAAAVAVPAGAANAAHLCVTSEGRDIVCAPHIDMTSEDPICITRGGQTVVCV